LAHGREGGLRILVIVEPPIICSLDSATAGSRVDERRALLGTATTEEPTDPASARMGLGGGVDTAAWFALAEREVQRCPFFRFVLEVASRGLGLAVAVPPDAISTLRDFARLAPT
jgi:hypothetical protein